MTVTASSSRHGAEVVEPARWARRAVGHLIDGVVALPLVTLLVAAFLLWASTSTDCGCTKDVPGMHGRVVLAQLLLSLWVLGVVGLRVWNRWWLQGRTGQRLGKRAVGLRLAGVADDGPVGAAAAMRRDLFHVLDVLSVVGWLWPLWDRRGQTSPTG